MLINASALSTEPIQWTVDGMIPRGGVVFVYGRRCIGKSLVFDVEMPLAIANPEHTFFGRKVIHGNVVVALGEGKTTAGVRIAARVDRQAADDAAARAADPNVTLPAYTDERLFIMTPPFPVLADKIGPLPALQVAVMQMKTIPDLEMVVLDAAENFTGGAQLSSSATATKFMAGLTYMAAELGCCVIVINHPVANGSKMKGAGELGDGADMVIAVNPDYQQEMDAATLSCEKNRDGPRFEPVTYLVHHPPAGAVGDGVSATVRLLAQTEEALVLPPPVPLRPPKRNGLFLRLVREGRYS